MAANQTRLFRLEHVFDQDVLLFVLLFENRSFSKVAELVGQNQSSVSRRILELENHLGLTLFDRKRRPIAPTPEGKSFYFELKQHSNALADTLLHLKTQNAINPVVRLGCVESLSLDLVPRVIEKLLPFTSKISQITGTSNTLLRLLLEHKLDVIVSSDAFSGIPLLHRRFLFREPSVLIISEMLARQKPGPWTWMDLQVCGKPFIYYHLESGGGRLNETYLSTHYLQLPNVLEVDSNTVMVSLVGSNLGWTITRPSTLLQTKILASGVVAVPMPEPLLTRDVYLISREGEEKAVMDTCYNAVLSVLHAWVIPELKKIAPWVQDHYKEAQRA